MSIQARFARLGPSRVLNADQPNAPMEFVSSESQRRDAATVEALKTFQALPQFAPGFWDQLGRGNPSPVDASSQSLPSGPPPSAVPNANQMPHLPSKLPNLDAFANSGQSGEVSSAATSELPDLCDATELFELRQVKAQMANDAAELASLRAKSDQMSKDAEELFDLRRRKAQMDEDANELASFRAEKARMSPNPNGLGN